ncbi:hypothetical protein PF007_g18065 [Phytophthora fragariae]|uniref:Uncharacterized protein n=1 Tax=Phytophthora fragariae TaxID=53985 RepID=A0A6A3ETZ1_9STRA|nr:hypothetical protein PF003_g13824 [Phytophthora fragariae]KAE8935491.1 hypothetical protein PF009_g14572 [Phytophthora fragariae]KAE9093611.1 hypothetical protein PF007_g18065 [Phytophthora fragariae]KAE9108931.1 hypothetical protein PF006_g20771 [Phytophthora fragariae]
MLLGLLRSGLAVVLRLEMLPLALYMVVVVLLKQHLAVTRAWASEVPVDSVLLLFKQHLDMAATRLSVSALLADSVVVLLKQHLPVTQLSASAVPANPVLAPLKPR